MKLISKSSHSFYVSRDNALCKFGISCIPDSDVQLLFVLVLVADYIAFALWLVDDASMLYAAFPHLGKVF